MRFLMGDGGVKMRGVVRGGEIPEPWPVQLKAFDQLYETFKDKPPTVGGLWELQAERQVYLRKLLDSWMASKDVTGTGRAFDGVIAPTQAFPAAPRYTFRHAGYTGIWNLADWTGVAFPAGTASKDDVKTEVFEPRNNDEKDIWEKCEYGIPSGSRLTNRRRRSARRHARRTPAHHPAPPRGARPQARRRHRGGPRGGQGVAPGQQAVNCE
jgi:amidase